MLQEACHEDKSWQDHQLPFLCTHRLIPECYFVIPERDDPVVRDRHTIDTGMLLCHS